MRAHAALAALALATALPVSAAAQAGEEFYSGPGGWRVLVQDINCALFSAQEAGRPRVVFGAFHDGNAFLEIHLPQPLAAELGDGPVIMRMGATQERLGLNDRRDELVLFGFPANLVAAFRGSQTMDLLVNGQVLAEIPLTGSAAAWSQFEACLPTLPAGPFRPSVPPPPPLPRPPVPEPQLSGPLPPNRTAQPIMARNWIAGPDLLVTGEQMAGTTRYSLIVGPDGRVRSCVLVASSGSSRQDETVCRAITRYARFEPATNAKGRPIEGTYAGSVEWQFTE